MQRYVLMIAVAGLLVSACNGAPAPDASGTAARSESEVSTAPGKTPDASPESAPQGADREVDPCRLLKDAELRELPGTRFALPTPSDFHGIPQCRWEADGATVVQVQAAPSADWGRNVGAAMKQLANNPKLSADDAKELAQAQQVLAERGELNARQACGMFSLIAEIGGAPPGATFTVQYIQADEFSVASTAQACTDGRFTSVAYHTRGLQESRQITRLMKATLFAAHRRAIQAAR